MSGAAILCTAKPSASAVPIKTSSLCHARAAKATDAGQQDDIGRWPRPRLPGRRGSETPQRSAGQILRSGIRSGGVVDRSTISRTTAASASCRASPMPRISIRPAKASTARAIKRPWRCSIRVRSSADEPGENCREPAAASTGARARIFPCRSPRIRMPASPSDGGCVNGP